VHLEPDAVPEAVSEVVAVPGVADQVARGGVHVPDVGARPGGVEAGSLRGRDQLVDLPLPPGGLAERDLLVMSAWYPPYRAPKSIVIRSPRRIGRSAGT